MVKKNYLTSRVIKILTRIKSGYSLSSLTGKVASDHNSEATYPPKGDHFTQLCSHKLLKRTRSWWWKDAAESLQDKPVFYQILTCWPDVRHVEQFIFRIRVPTSYFLPPFPAGHWLANPFVQIWAQGERGKKHMQPPVTSNHSATKRLLSATLRRCSILS